MNEWDSRYDTEKYRYGTEPVRFLTEAVEGTTPGTALCIGAGEGRNAVWLAEKGWDVTALDLSKTGLEKAASLAGSRGVSLKTVEADAAEWEMGTGQWNLVTLFFVHAPPRIRKLIHRKAAAALAPGGLIVLEAFSPRQLGRGTGGPGTSRSGEPPSPDLAPLFIEASELPEELPGLEMILLKEEQIRLTGGTHHNGGDASVVHCIGKKTMSSSPGFPVRDEIFVNRQNHPIRQELCRIAGLTDIPG